MLAGRVIVIVAVVYTSRRVRACTWEQTQRADICAQLLRRRLLGRPWCIDVCTGKNFRDQGQTQASFGHRVVRSRPNHDIPASRPVLWDHRAAGHCRRCPRQHSSMERLGQWIRRAAVQASTSQWLMAASAFQAVPMSRYQH